MLVGLDGRSLRRVGTLQRLLDRIRRKRGNGYRDQAIAEVALLIALARLLQGFRWSGCDAPARPEPLTTLRPFGGVRVHVERRAPA